jgi:hypothetical protein
MSDASAASSQIISLPQGGGALHGIGEKFSPDLHTGTGNFTVPIALPPGRNGFQPDLKLTYSTGNGNGAFGLGWVLSIPGVSRKTAKGVPRYDDAQDTFILSGAEDLVPVPGAPDGAIRYRPRTEGLFACTDHYRTPASDYWGVRSKDGLRSFYGTPARAGSDPAALTRPNNAKCVFAWKLTETRDPFGNLIRYDYEADNGDRDGHRWNQPLLSRIRYVDFGDPADGRFLVHVQFAYEGDRPDSFSDHRPGFEVRTTKRCSAIDVFTQTEDGQQHPVRQYRFSYVTDPCNGVSLLRQIDIIGYDDAGNAYQDDGPDSAHPKQLPPLTFGHTLFIPDGRRFEVVTGRDLPAPGSTGKPRVNRWGSNISRSAAKLFECPLCGVADKKRRCSNRSARTRTALVNWLSTA